MTILFDIPYQPTDPDGWAVTFPDGTKKHFASRADALTAVLAAVRFLSLREGKDAMVSVEGADGRWRLFNAHVKAPLGRDP